MGCFKSEVFVIKMRIATVQLCCLALLTSTGCARQQIPAPPRLGDRPALSASQPAESSSTQPPIDWKHEIGDAIAPPGGLIAELNAKEQVYTIKVPRSDLDLTIDGMSVPTAAGLASTFHFYRCSCGKMSVLGEFLVIDYEANDVIDALRQGATIRITAVAPVAIGDHPHLLSIRFHGEGEPTPLAKLIKEALRWTGAERMKP